MAKRKKQAPIQSVDTVTDSENEPQKALTDSESTAQTINQSLSDAQSNDHSDLNIFKAFTVWFAPNVDQSIVDQFALHGGNVSDRSLSDLIDEHSDIDVVISDENDDVTNEIRAQGLALYIVSSLWVIESLRRSSRIPLNCMFLPPVNQSMTSSALVLSYQPTLCEALEKRDIKDRVDEKNKRRKRNGMKPIDDTLWNDQPTNQSDDIAVDQSNDQSTDELVHQPLDESPEPVTKKAKKSKSKKSDEVVEPKRKSRTESALAELIADLDDTQSMNQSEHQSPVIQPISRHRPYLPPISNEQTLIQQKLLDRRSIPARELREKLPVPQPDVVKTPQVRAVIRTAPVINDSTQPSPVNRSIVEPSPAKPRISLRPHPSTKKSRKRNSEAVISSSEPANPLDFLSPDLANRVREAVERRQAERERQSMTANKQAKNPAHQSINRPAIASPTSTVTQHQAPPRRTRAVDEWEPDPDLLTRLLAMRKRNASINRPANQPQVKPFQTRRALDVQLSASQEDDTFSLSQANGLSHVPSSGSEVDSDVDRAIRHSVAADPFAWSPSRTVRQRLSAHLTKPRA